MQRNLSFDQTPPLSVPLRFFLSAPLFAVAAGLLLVVLGPDLWQSRWTPGALALTHMLTLGFLAMAMIGALIQILPVVAGVNIPRAQTTAAIVHVLLTTGTLTLASAFLSAQPLLFGIALPLLGAALLLLATAAGIGAWRTEGASAMLVAIRFALAALGITVAAGLALGSAFAWQVPLPLQQLTEFHAGWGLIGWIGLLVTGVAFQVVPMFQVTPLYPAFITRRLPAILFGALALWSASTLFFPAARLMPGLAAAAIAVSLALFAGATLFLLKHRKRPKGDTTMRFWYTSMGSLLAGVALWALHAAMPQLLDERVYSLMLGTLMIVGFGYSVVNGMLYKIVPFLVWYHLQSKMTGGCIKVPNVKKILPDEVADKQFYAHLGVLGCAIAAAIVPSLFAHATGLALALSSAWLWRNLYGAAKIYRSVSAADAAATAAAAAAAAGNDPQDIETSRMQLHPS
jgi:hypothetical protein